MGDRGGLIRGFKVILGDIVSLRLAWSARDPENRHFSAQTLKEDEYSERMNSFLLSDWCACLSQLTFLEMEVHVWNHKSIWQTFPSFQIFKGLHCFTSSLRHKAEMQCFRETPLLLSSCFIYGALFHWNTLVISEKRGHEFEDQGGAYSMIWREKRGGGNYN